MGEYDTGSMSWGDLIDAYIDFKRSQGRKEKTLDSHRIRLDELARICGSTPENVDESRIRHAIDSQPTDSLRNKARTAYSQFFIWMQEQRLRRDNPTDGLERIGRRTADDVYRRSELPPKWRDAVTGFIEYKKAGGCSQQTLTTRFYQLRRFATTTSLAPEEVTTGDLLAALADAESQYTRKGLRNCFSTFFRYLQAMGLRKDNPAAMLPNMRTPRPQPRPCPDSIIMDALTKANADERLMILLASECGLRRNEIAQIHTDDVLRSVHGTYSLIVHGKGGKQRIVPLPDELAETIIKRSGWAFPGRFGGHVEAGYVGRSVGKLLPQRYSVHKLRHRFATVAYSDTHDMLAVSRALGHANTEITQNYIALADESLRPLVNAAALADQMQKYLYNDSQYH